MSTSQQADPLIGRLVDGRYRVRARIARGGMATVYVATDLRLERRIALKVMHSHLSDDTVFQDRFIQEARSAARLANPNVVNVFDQGQDGELAYLVMEYLPGITLRELMREQRRLSVAQTITIMDSVLTGLAAAHRAGIVHRDVKPENILLAEDGRIKIGDFGLARATTANTATGAQLLGTIAYLAPELVTRGTADARSDIYALGILLYEMLVGEQPYKGEQPMQIAFQHATDSVPRPSAKNPSIPEPLDELVLWATEKVPDERPNDAQQMLDRLREIERELGVTPIVSRAAVTAGIATIDEGGTSTDLTQVMPASLTGPTASLEMADNATQLRRKGARRKTRGGWLMAIVLVLAVLAGGVGWWLGSGPGSMVPVRDVAGLSFADAQALLAEDSLEAVEAPDYSLEVAPGLAIRTDPSPGTRLDRDSQVSVIISHGARPQSVASLSGMTAEQARGVLSGASLVVGDDAREFSSTEEGVLIAAYVTPRTGGEPVACIDGCEVFEGDTASLVVSLGEIPDVAGQSVGDATGTLNERELQVNPDSEFVYSDRVDRDRVIAIADRPDGGNWLPGDTITLIVSLGPELFEVPNVVGMTRDAAKNALDEAGFAFEYNSLWDVVLDGATRVEAQEPEAGERAERGSSVSMRITGSF